MTKGGIVIGVVLLAWIIPAAQKPWCQRRDQL
jgi:hypothetical protein